MKKVFSIIILFTAIKLNAQILSEKDRVEMLSVLNKQSEYQNKSDLVGYMDGYWKSDSLRFIGKSGIKYGWNATLESYKKGYPDKEAMGFLKFDVISLEGMNSNTAFMIGKWNLDRREKSVSGYFTLVWRKINGKWLVIIDHSS